MKRIINVKDAEIEQLKAANKSFSEKVGAQDTEIQWLKEAQSAEIERLKALLTRAADALEDLKGPGWKRELIAELRKVAQ